MSFIDISIKQNLDSFFHIFHCIFFFYHTCTLYHHIMMNKFLSFKISLSSSSGIKLHSTVYSVISCEPCFSANFIHFWVFLMMKRRGCLWFLIAIDWKKASTCLLKTSSRLTSRRKAIAGWCSSLLLCITIRMTHSLDNPKLLSTDKSSHGSADETLSIILSVQSLRGQ